MIHAVVGLMRHEWIQVRRYWLNYLSGTLVYYVLFLLAVYGSRTSGNSTGVGAARDSLVVGFWVVSMTNVAFERTGFFVANQAMMGTLEQLYLSPFGFGWILVASLLVGLLTILFVTVPLLLLLMATTGQWLHVNPLTLTPLVAVIVAQAYAIGLCVGALALIHKRVQGLNQAALLVLLVFIAAPRDLSPLVRVLPLNGAWQLLRDAMTDGRLLWELPLSDVVLVIAQTGVLLAVSWAFFRWCERVAKARGLLGQY